MGSSADGTSRIIWRLSNHVDLSGRGGLIASGRWHTKPKPVLYCAEEPHTAYLEVLRHFNGNPLLLPEPLKLLRVSVPRYVSCHEIDRSDLDAQNPN